MRKTTIYQIVLAILLMLLPISAVAQQANDIKKPTRTRVTEKDKKNTTQKTVESKDAKNDTKTTDKKDNKAPEKKDNKAPEKPVPVKDEKAQVKKEPEKPVTDTTAKVVQPKPKKVPTPVDPSKVQYDGLDVSKHQGNINWEELKKYDKIKYVYIKATEGSNHEDAKYKENIKNARKNGFKVGSYHFFRTTSSARTQAINFLQVANRNEQDLIPVIDVEENKNWSKDQLRDSVKVFVDIVEDYYGCKPMIYASETFFNRHLGLAFKDYPLFIAKYSDVNPNVNIKWILWQFSECGKFKGVKDNLVDMSRFNKGFTIENILYKPGKTKPKSSIKDIVDHKEKPASVNMTEQKQAPAKSKRQIEEEKRKAEKDKKTQERNKKVAEEEAKKKAEADKKAKEKAEQVKKEKARQAAREEAAKKEAEAKAKRKADAAKAREQKAKQNEAAKKTNNKTASLLNPNASKISQSQHNDSVRNAQLKGRKTIKSSADND